MNDDAIKPKAHLTYDESDPNWVIIRDLILAERFRPSTTSAIRSLVEERLELLRTGYLPNDRGVQSYLKICLYLLENHKEALAEFFSELASENEVFRDFVPIEVCRQIFGEVAAEMLIHRKGVVTPEMIDRLKPTGPQNKFTHGKTSK